MIILNALLAIGVLSSPSYTINENGIAYNHLHDNEVSFIEDNLTSLTSNDSLLFRFKNNENIDASTALRDYQVGGYLDNNYSNYSWTLNNTVTLSSTSGFIPENVQNPYYDFESELSQAIINSGTQSTYGGCGPIAMIGILDYYGRYLGYREIIDNPLSPSDRIQLATEVFSTVRTFEVGFGEKSTFTFPQDYAAGFNTIISNHGLGNYISCQEIHKLFSGQKDNYLNIVKTNVNQGKPVTLMTGLFSGDGDFAQHYTNIVGYETWIGTNGGQSFQKDFIIARLNFGYSDALFYCDSEILDDGMIGLITYDCKSTSRFGAVDFAEEFVNSQGGGQYFNIEKGAPVTFLSNEQIQTYRLRTSYIENQYLVMSANKANCGLAYLEMIFNHSVSVMTFDISLWGPNENINAQSLYLYYYDGSDWVMDQSIELSDLSTNKASPNRMEFTFPSDAVGVKIYTWHTNPSGDYNRGRICLDNFVIGY